MYDNEPTPLAIVRNLVQLADEYTTTSLPEFTKPTRVSPLVLIDESLTTTDPEALSNALQTMLSIFTAHYLQAVSLMTNVDGVSTVGILDSLSTSRNVKRGIGAGYMDAMSRLGKTGTGLESYADLSAGVEARANDDDLQSHVNMAIGRVLQVDIGVGDKRIPMRINATINPLVIKPDVLPAILANVSKDKSIIGRYHQWRSGEIESFTDYIFALDLIEADRKALLNDGSGVYKEARDRKNKGLIATIASGRASINNASAMAVISEATAGELELALKGRLKSSRTRMDYFKSTNSMLLMVMDPRKERIRIYQRGIDEVGMFTYTDIENVNKRKDAIDINSMLKAFQLGKSPSL